MPQQFKLFRRFDTPPGQTPTPAVTLINLVVTDGTVNEGGSITLALSGIYSNRVTAPIANNLATWPANAPNGVLTVPVNDVTGDSRQVSITVSYGGRTATAKVQILDKTVVLTPTPVVSLTSLDMADVVVNEGSSVGLAPIAGYSNNTNSAVAKSAGTWSDNAPNGVFTAPANSVVGDSYTATVTFTYGGRTATAKVQVVDKTVPVAPPLEPVTASQLLRVTATYPTAPVNPVVAFDEQPGGYQIIWSYTSDDGYVGDLKVIAPVIFGGTVAHMNGRDPLLDAGGQPITTTYPGVKFSDGCGKMVQAGFATALNAGYVEGARDPYYGEKLSKQDFIDLCKKLGYDLENHTDKHTFDADGAGPDNAYLELKDNNDWVKANLGRDMRVMVIPGGLAGGVGPYFDNADLNGLKALSEGFKEEDKYFREVAGGRISPDRYGWPNGDVNYHWSDQAFFDRNFNEARMLNWRRQLVSRANHDTNFSTANVQRFRTWVDGHVEWKNTNQVRVQVPFFTHSMAWDQAANFAACCDYLLNHPNLNGRAGILSNHQCAEYAEAIALSKIGPVTVVGNTITFDIDQSAIPNVSRYLNLTLNLPAGATSVTVQGATDFSFNAQGLVNIYKKRGEVSPTPVPDSTAARVTGKLPINSLLELTNLQAPAQDYVSAGLDDAVTVAPPRYGGLLPITETKYKPRKGSRPVLHSIAMDDKRFYGFDVRFVEIKADKTERELLHYTGSYDASGKYVGPTSATFTTAADSTYVFRQVGANCPSVIDIQATRTPVSYPVVGPRTKYPAENFTLVHAHYYQLCENFKSQAVSPVFSPMYDLWAGLGGGRVYIDANNINYERDTYIVNIDHAGRDQDALKLKMKADGLRYILDYKEVPDWLYAFYTEQQKADTGYTREWPPVNPPSAPRNTMAAWSWADEFAYNMVARDGYNKNIDPATLKFKQGQLYPGDPRYVYKLMIALGVLDIFEFWNEIEKYWKGLGVYLTGEHFAYFCYAVRLGVRRADPEGKVKISCTGLATVKADYLMACMDTMAVIAPLNADGTPLVPWDIVQVHFYPTTDATGQQYAAGSSAQMIELSAGPQLFADFIEINAQLLGRKPIWVGEVGACWKLNTPPYSDSGIVVRVPAGATWTQKEYHGIHYLRTARFFWALGDVEAIVHYQLTDDNPTRPDITYSTCGIIDLVDDGAGNITPVPRPAWYLLKQWRTLLAGYCHESALNEHVDIAQKPGARPAYVVGAKTASNSSFNTSVVLSGNYMRHNLNLHGLVTDQVPVSGGTYATVATELMYILLPV